MKQRGFYQSLPTQNLFSISIPSSLFSAALPCKLSKRKKIKTFNNVSIAIVQRLFRILFKSVQKKICSASHCFVFFSLNSHPVYSYQKSAQQIFYRVNTIYFKISTKQYQRAHTRTSPSPHILSHIHLMGIQHTTPLVSNFNVHQNKLI